MDKKSHKRISEVQYVGPQKTLTQQLTSDEIKDLLDGYKQTSFDELKPFYHVRYYKKDKKTNEVKFQTGGTIIKINDEKRYVVLSSGTLSWSVQNEGTIFYQAVPLSEMKIELENKYKDEIQKLTNENNILTAYATKLDSKVTELTNENNKLKKELSSKKSNKNLN